MDESALMTDGVFTRDARFKYPPSIDLAEAMKPSVREIRPNHYKGMSRASLRATMERMPSWRHHHDLPFLEDAADERTLLRTYSKRVQDMIRMVEDALAYAGIPDDLAGQSMCDLACAEGFVTDHFIRKGVKGIDCYELNLNQIQRFHLVQAYKRQEAATVYRLDFEGPAWRLAIPETYDVVLCLGIVYHMQNPMTFLQNVYDLTGKVCVVESDTNVTFGDQSLLIPVEQTMTKAPGDVRFLFEMRPTRQALVDMLLAVGFSSVKVMAPPADGVCPYLRDGRKSVLLAIK